MQFLQILQRILGKKAASVARSPSRSVSATSIQIVAPESSLKPGTPRYPPLDSGIGAATVEEILSTQADLIGTLRRNLGLPPEKFDRNYLQPLRRAAEAINLLPVTRDKHHTGAGGLFRFAVSIAVHAARSAEGKIFAAQEKVAVRRDVEDAWRHAAFLTGLVCELYRVLTEMVVTDERGEQWSPFVSGLTTWANKAPNKRYFVRWHQREDQRSVANSLAGWAVSSVIGNEILDGLHRVKPDIVVAIAGVTSGAISTADNSALATLIGEVRARVIKRDNELQPMTYGKLTSGSHLEPYFLDAMRALVQSGVWQINTKAARCHYGADGFFIAWKSGSKELLGRLASQNIQGVPTTLDTLADMMGKAGILKHAGDGSWIHLARAAVGDATFAAIQLQSPSTILRDVEMTPVNANLRVQPGKQAPSVPVVPGSAPKAGSSPASKKGTETGAVPAPVVEQVAIFIDNAIAEAHAKGNVDGDTGEIAPGSEVKDKTPEAPPKAKKGERVPKAKKEEAPQEATESPVAPNPKNPVQSAAIPAVPEGDDGNEVPMDKELLMELGTPLCNELANFRDRWNRNMDRSHFLRTPEGLAISYSLLSTECAVPFAKLVDKLKESGYLHTRVQNNKTVAFQQIPFGDAKGQLGIVILTTIARKAGFILE